MFRYIDIHTHALESPSDGISVLNHYDHFEQAASDQRYCSLGIHPWYINEAEPEAQLVSLGRYAALPQVLAIGECGLDKVTETPFSLQERAFEAQLQLAQQLQKPLIIHCVRAFEELIRMVHSAAITVPVIVHGFNKNRHLAKQLLDQGFFLSFGKALLKEGLLQEIFAVLPVDRFFLETDNSGLDIAAIYKAAAEIRKIQADEIILQLQLNFKNVFGK